MEAEIWIDEERISNDDCPGSFGEHSVPNFFWTLVFIIIPY
jgi:hypothetical protein